MKHKLALSALLALALLLAACGPQATPTSAPAPAATEAPAQSSSSNNPYGYDVYPTTEPTTAASSSSSAGSQAATVAVGTGGFLVDANGMTLYLFTKDTTSASTCSGGCATNWPPLTVTGQPVAGTGVDASLLGTTTRADGSIQVTYNGHPLYYYKNDHAAGDKTGQGVGGVWYVVAATGDAMK